MLPDWSFTRTDIVPKIGPGTETTSHSHAGSSGRVSRVSAGPDAHANLAAGHPHPLSAQACPGREESSRRTGAITTRWLGWTGGQLCRAGADAAAGLFDVGGEVGAPGVDAAGGGELALGQTIREARGAALFHQDQVVLRFDQLAKRGPRGAGAVRAVLVRDAGVIDIDAVGHPHPGAG